FDSRARERIERLQQIVLTIARQLVQFVKKPRSRHRGMLKIGNGEFADLEVPVGMSNPLDIELLPQIKRQRDALAHQLIDNAAVIYTVNGKKSGITTIKQPVFLFDQFADICGSDAEALLCDQEVGQSLLLETIQ